jgi:hypothetical protein
MTHSPRTLSIDLTSSLTDCLLMDESLWLIPCLLILYSYAYRSPDSSDCSARWVMLTQLDYWSITVHITHTLTHGLVLYLDTDRHVYKSPLKVHWDFRSDLVVISTIYSVSSNPPQAILGTLSHLGRRPLVVITTYLAKETIGYTPAPSALPQS